MNAAIHGIFGATRRQRAAVAAVAVIGAFAAGAALLELWRLAAAVAIVLLTAAVLTGLDLRRRAAELARQVKILRSSGPLTARQLERLEEDARQRTVEAVRSSQQELRAAVEALNGRATPAATATSAADGGLQEKLVRNVWKLLREQTREFEALLQLYARVELPEPMPLPGWWALNPQGLLHVYALVQRHRPDVVVELGSGTSTVWIGYALAANGSGRLVSLEHLEEYVESSTAIVEPHRADIAPTEVRWAPLTSVTLGDREFQWYSADSLKDLDRIDMLLVDGPPGDTGTQARYPALPMLRDRLSEGAVIVVDDAAREDEQGIVDRWMAEIPGLVREPSAVDRQVVLRYMAGRPNGGTEDAGVAATTRGEGGKQPR